MYTFAHSKGPRLIVSAGFDDQVLVWDPHIDLPVWAAIPTDRILHEDAYLQHLIYDWYEGTSSFIFFFHNTPIRF